MPSLYAALALIPGRPGLHLLVLVLWPLLFTWLNLHGAFAEIVALLFFTALGSLLADAYLAHRGEADLRLLILLRALYTGHGLALIGTTAYMVITLPPHYLKLIFTQHPVLLSMPIFAFFIGHVLWRNLTTLPVLANSLTSWSKPAWVKKSDFGPRR